MSSGTNTYHIPPVLPESCKGWWPHLQIHGDRCERRLGIPEESFLAFFKEQSSTSMLGKIVQNWGSFVGPNPSISGLSFEHWVAMRKDLSSMYRY